MANKATLSWTKPLLIDEGIRAVICMLPMLVAMVFGQIALLSALGQGGFYFSYLPLPQRKGQRFIMGSVISTIGLGFYLLGGNVVFNPWIAIVFTFFIGMNLVLLSSWKIVGPLAFSFISIYAAGLNASSPEKVHQSFLAFLFAMGWAAVISLLPFWKGTPLPKKKASTPEIPIFKQIEVGIRMGLGTALAELISQLLGFSKMGWATSGVGNVIRYDLSSSKARAKLRMIGTVAGVVILMVSLRITNSAVVLSLATLVYAFLNGLTKATKLGQTVTLYTATILTLYALNNLADAKELSTQRIVFNLIGVLIGVWVALYPFPRIFSKIKSIAATTGQDVQT